MSTSFEVFPTNTCIPNIEDVISTSVELLNRFFKKNQIEKDFQIELEIYNLSNGNKLDKKHEKLITSEDEQLAIIIRNEGYTNIFYHDLINIDCEFWESEMQYNKNALALKSEIEMNKKIGYYWSVKRNVGQPPVVNLLYGYVAIAIAKVTDGFIYSDDGAWDYNCFPSTVNIFEKDYLSIEVLSDNDMKNFILYNINELKNNIVM